MFDSFRVSSSRRDFLKLGAASAFSSLCLPRDLFAETAANASPVVLRCAVMSDVHYDGLADAQEVARFRRAVRFMYEYSASQPHDTFDALVVVGDMSNHGTENEIGLFKQTVDEELRGETERVLCMGNHEFYGGGRELWQKTFGVEPTRRYEVGGYRFLMISPLNGAMQPGDFGYARDWLEQELADATAADPEKPIFVCQHYPISPTIFGGRGLDDWGLLDLYDTLQRYPKVVDFSGHTHYPLSDPRVVWQGNFTAFGTSSVSYICHETFGRRYPSYPCYRREFSEFYVMEVRADGSVALMPYDLAKDAFYDFVFDFKPGAIDEYQYTDKRYSTSARPEWPENTPKRVAATDHDAVVTVPRPQCPDVVFEYRCDVERMTPDGWSAEPSQFFLSRYHEHPAPESIDVVVAGLASNAQYRVSVHAVTAFRKGSVRPLVFEFQTAARSSDPADARPEADFLDVRPLDGAIVDASKRAQKLVGAPKVAHDDALGGDVMTFDGASAIRLDCTAYEYEELRRVSLGARFRADSARTTGMGSIVSNSEEWGTALSVDYATRELSFWVTVGDAPFLHVAAPIPFDRWLDAFGVFDGRDAILYVDGKEVARTPAIGRLRHPDDPFVLVFTVGGDVAAYGATDFFFTGAIERARVYTYPLSAEQVANLSEKRA